MNLDRRRRHGRTRPCRDGRTNKRGAVFKVCNTWTEITLSIPIPCTVHGVLDAIFALVQAEPS